MSLAKTAQRLENPVELDKGLLYSADDSLDVNDELEYEEDDDFDPEEEMEEHHHESKHNKDPHVHGKGEILVIVNEEPMEKEFEFVLPLVPGGEIQDEIEEDENELAVEEEEDEIKVEAPDHWDWQSIGLGNFVGWLKGMLEKVPSHSGTDTAGLERAISYMESINRIISKAVRADLKDEINVSDVEKIRDEIHKGIERLEDRLDKINTNKYKKNKKKKADSEDQDGLVKEAQKIAGVGKTVVTVPLLISHIVRVCINATISSGKDMEDTFKKLADKYSLTLREKAETVALLNDYGFPLRHREVDFDSDFDPSSENNIEYIQQFHG